MSEKTNIGNRIQVSRKEKSLSQEELAEMLEISQSYLSKIESGVEKPGRDLIGKFCEALDITTDYVYYGKSEQDNPRLDGYIAWLQRQTPEIQSLVLEMNEPIIIFLDNLRKKTDENQNPD